MYLHRRMYVEEGRGCIVGQIDQKKRKRRRDSSRGEEKVNFPPTPLRFRPADRAGCEKPMDFACRNPADRERMTD